MFSQSSVLHCVSELNPSLGLNNTTSHVYSTAHSVHPFNCRWTLGLFPLLLLWIMLLKLSVQVSVWVLVCTIGGIYLTVKLLDRSSPIFTTSKVFFFLSKSAYRFTGGNFPTRGWPLIPYPLQSSNSCSLFPGVTHWNWGAGRMDCRKATVICGNKLEYSCSNF